MLSHPVAPLFSVEFVVRGKICATSYGSKLAYHKRNHKTARVGELPRRIPPGCVVPDDVDALEHVNRAATANAGVDAPRGRFNEEDPLSQFRHGILWVNIESLSGGPLLVGLIGALPFDEVFAVAGAVALVEEKPEWRVTPFEPFLPGVRERAVVGEKSATSPIDLSTPVTCATAAVRPTLYRPVDDRPTKHRAEGR